MNNPNPLRAAAEARLGPVRVARQDGALYFAPASGELVRLSPEDVAPFEAWADVQPRGLGADMMRLRGGEVRHDELALLTLGIKQLELHAAPDAWRAYDRALRQLAARCLREGCGGGALYACWAAMALCIPEGRMEKHVALLRGINVGGKNMISMPLLKTAFEDAGFSGVSTYINSGNIIFCCEEEEPVSLQQRCRKIIMDAFQLDIPVAVISTADYSDAIAHAPAWWDQDGESKHNAIFVIAPADPAAMIQEVGIRPEYEKIAHRGRVIFWSAPISTFSRTRWAKVMGTSAYSSITIRNANTTKKLLNLLAP